MYSFLSQSKVWQATIKTRKDFRECIEYSLTRNNEDWQIIRFHLLPCAGAPGADSFVISLALGGRIPSENPRVPLHGGGIGVCAR